MQKCFRSLHSVLKNRSSVCHKGLQNICFSNLGFISRSVAVCSVGLCFQYEKWGPPPKRITYSYGGGLLTHMEVGDPLSRTGLPTHMEAGYSLSRAGPVTHSHGGGLLTQPGWVTHSHGGGLLTHMEVGDPGKMGYPMLVR